MSKQTTNKLDTKGWHISWYWKDKSRPCTRTHIEYQLFCFFDADIFFNKRLAPAEVEADVEIVSEIILNLFIQWDHNTTGGNR